MPALFAIPPELYHMPGFYDPFSAISHLVGVVAFLVLGAILLWRGRGSRVRLFYLGVYAFSCVFLFTMSMCFHMMVVGGTARRVMERLDHSAIFILIAGTFTPAYGILYTGWRRWAPLLFVWTCAITGITLEAIFFDNLPETLGLSIYLGLGWFGAFSTYFLARRFGLPFVKPLIWGGLAYTVGAVMEHFGWFVIVPGVVHAHELFHLFVLLGAGFHWWFVWEIADG
ncbi:MAG TPA: hemolysin III family protein, partial [Pirellulales bacterium]|nr:hemolysin III family protein [Pirellulales bacterium]